MFYIAVQFMTSFNHNPWRQFTITAHLKIKNFEVGRKRILKFRRHAVLNVELQELNQIYVRIFRSEYDSIHATRAVFMFQH